MLSKTIPTGEQTLPIPTPLIELMKRTEQNPRYHAEGNVYNHTLMVMEQYKLHVDDFDLSEADRKVLYWTAALHDIGKPRVTRWKDKRWSARGHEQAGIPLARNILLQQPGITAAQREGILRLIRWHSVPLRWGLAARELSPYKRLATQVDLRLLGVFAFFDLKGRLCEDKNKIMDLVGHFNQQIVPRVQAEMGSYQAIQQAYQQANLTHQNALWHALKFDNIRLLEKLLHTQTKPTQGSIFDCVLRIGPQAPDAGFEANEHYPAHRRFALADAAWHTFSPQEQSARLMAAKNFILIHAESGKPVLIEGNLTHTDLRQALMHCARQAYGKIFYHTEAVALDKLLKAVSDPQTYQLLNHNFHQWDVIHPWEAHQWRSSKD